MRLRPHPSVIRCRRLYSKKPTENASKESEEAERDHSALIDRFTQIAEAKLQHSGNPSQQAKLDPTFNKLYDQYKPNSIDQRAAGYIKSEPLLNTNPHAKDIAQAQPWKGSESVIDGNLRMLMDSAPKPMKNNGRRLHDAREASLDYKLNPKKSEDEQFREMYRERLLGPSMFKTNGPSSGVDLIGSVAGAKINASINQDTGKFDSAEMTSIRGKPLDRDHLRNSTDTNYFMNQLLNKQQVLPPFVESQQSIHSEITGLRKSLDDRWFNYVLNKSAISNQLHLKSATLFGGLELFKANFSPNVILTLPEKDQEYVEAHVADINQKIRSYNLQCPSTHLHRLKLSVDKESNESYQRMVREFPERYTQWYEQHRAKRILNNYRSHSGGKGNGFLGIFGEDTPSSKGPHQDDKETTIEVPVRDYDTKLGLWKAIKDVFK
ncbi:hypothetical protein DIRU0_B14466 [Diutina rugosa]